MALFHHPLPSLPDWHALSSFAFVLQLRCRDCVCIVTQQQHSCRRSSQALFQPHLFSQTPGSPFQFVEMAATMASMATPVVAGLGGSSLSARRAASKVQLRSAFVAGERSSFMAPMQLDRPLCISRVTCFNRDWLRKDLSVIGFGLIGWLAPSSLPLINGNSLTGLFFGSIGPELAHFPTGPSLTSPFWLWMITWHVGLFVILLLGQIGFKGRQDGYWE